MARFFKQFPKIEYDFNRTGVKQNMVDLFRGVRPLPSFLDNYSAYKFYEIKNGERPDIVSRRLYNSPDFYWTFFVVNDFLHDGYRAWPLSQEALFDFIEKEYEGYVIETSPDIIRTGDGLISEFKDSLAGRFQLGETITGATSGATGKLTKKNIDINQLIVQEVTGAFIGNPDSTNNLTELVIGSTTGDSVSTFEVFKYAEAPYYYYLTGDADKKPVSNAAHFSPLSTGGVERSLLSYQSNRDHEYEVNEERSKIRYVDPNYIGQFVDKFKSAINA